MGEGRVSGAGAKTNHRVVERLVRVEKAETGLMIVPV